MAGRIHNDVTDDLGSRIVAGEIAPDAVFTLAQLEHDYNASRTVARDAVQVLESLGLVASRRRVGITVQPRDSWDALAPRVIGWNLHGPFRQQQLEALMELRVAVEPTAARLAAARASAAQRAELRRLASRLRTLAVEGGGASDDFLAADVRFHDLLLHASGNPQLIALRAPVREVLTGRTRLGLTPQMPAPGTLEEHESVAAAISTGDGAEAEAHSRSHMLAVWGEVQTDDSLA
ncbi:MULTISPECIES: FadR/GntR family transcriptional regulator [unclassified Microbacterium]|uniref:FadR/GntR family transcriptional regulator n=1 Tax=unclassified Microbacterium TaxID=2609290 RepID=UPI00097ECFEC|nr:FCD domain-containing protein [Microbacterium sp. JB110]RCS62799.1 FadR family transcriptional regulator [Microbacterium sp. JB110]SJM62583.1 Transcriptional regulator, GntR family [Frigoribacterium sp. JB110]